MSKSPFLRQLAERQTKPENRKWIYVPYDQVTDVIGPLSRLSASEAGIILIENSWKPARRPYHKQKLALIIANLREFALEQAARGVAVKHVITHGPYHKALADIALECGAIQMMEAAERELAVDLAPLIQSKVLEVVPHEGWLTVVPHEGWLTDQDDLELSVKQGSPWRMDAFYRRVRQRNDILMEKNGKPIGGKYSFDADNRRAWNGTPRAPKVPQFPVDEIKEEVAWMIEKYYSRHPGKLDIASLPGTASDAQTMWTWAKKECMENFGPFEDAMHTDSSGLFHTRISALLNISRLLPRQVVDDVEGMSLPISSKEGFIRQVAGWREYVHQVHVATDGFRKIPAYEKYRKVNPTIAEVPGDGGYRLWAGASWLEKGEFEKNGDDPDGGAEPSFMGAANDLPPAYWGEKSGLNCLDSVVGHVWTEAYSHHITRLMVLSNIAMLLEVSPRQLTDWFWVAYFDAYDWVVEPNVLAMGTYGVGDLMTTKPYICGAAYINKMSNFCKSCAFDPAKNCPITSLYWAYVERHKEKLKNNLRFQMPLMGIKKRKPEQIEKDGRVYSIVSQRLAKGQTVKPADFD